MGRLAAWLSAAFPGFTRKKAVLYFLCLVIPFTLENAVEIIDHRPAPNSNLLVPIVLYQWITTVGPRKPRAHFVRLVMIDRTTEPEDIASETSPCVQRQFMARLLSSIAAAQPAVMVIDKFYPPDVCTPEQTRDLLQVLPRVAHQVPLIVLHRDVSEDDLQGRPAEKLEVLREKKAVVSFPTIDFGPDVHYGLKVLNADERRIPLEWPVFSAQDFDTKPAEELKRMTLQRQETLAVATVRQYDPGTLSQQTIQSFIRSSTHPFTSFLQRSEIPTDAAIDLVCAAGHPRDFDWRNCPPVPMSSDRLKNYRNRVVVIGQNLPNDMHRTVVGSVPGVVLQANYIESLLDDRYFKPVPLWVQLLISVLWLGVVEYYFAHWETHPDRALAFAAATIGLLWLITYDVAVLQLGRYLVLWPPSAIAMLSRYVQLKLKP